LLELDRMAIEEAGPNPERLAAAIHLQLRDKGGAVPVYAIAKSLDIVRRLCARAQSAHAQLCSGDALLDEMMQAQLKRRKRNGSVNLSPTITGARHCDCPLDDRVMNAAQ
jgi:hypothetical protein